MKQIKARVALLHHTGGGNLGDDASVDVVINNIRQRWPEAEITILSMNPGDTVRKHGVPSYPIRRYTWGIGYKSDSAHAGPPEQGAVLHWLKTTHNPVIRGPRGIFGEIAFLISSLRILIPFDLMVVSGGGQLTEQSGPWGFPYAIFAWVLMTKAQHVKCVFLNVGAGPLNHRLSKFFLKRALFAADYVSFRDRQSQSLALRIGFRGESHVFPDNVYGLEPSLVTATLGKRDRPIVGINPIPYPFCDPREHPSGDQAIYEDFIAKIAKFSDSLVRRSRSLKFFGSDIGVDFSAIEDLRKALRNRYELFTPEYDGVNSVDELLSRMSTMDYVVTCRFHVVVFAQLLNKPVLAISHHPKVANLMSDLGLSQYCVDIQTFESSQLTEAFELLVNDTEKVKSTMGANLVRRRSQLKIQFDELFPPHPEQERDSQRSQPEYPKPIAS